MKTRGAWRSRHPVLAKVAGLAIAAALIGFGVYVAWHGDLSIRVRYGYRVFHGPAAWLLAFGLVVSGVSAALAVWRGPWWSPALIVGLVGAVTILAVLFLTLFGLM